MTEHFIKPDPIAWEHAFSEFQSAKENLQNLGTPGEALVRRAALDRYCDAETALLRQSAPSLAAIIDKLMIMWDGDIFLDFEESAQKRIIIGDLRGVQMRNGLA